MLLRFLLLLSAAAASEPALAADPRTPTGKWVVEFAENECLLSRSYGTDRKPLFLAFDQVPMETGLQLILLKKGGRRDLRRGTARVDFGDGRQTVADYGALPLVGGTRRITIEIEDDSYRAAVSTGVMSAEIRGEISESFAVPGFGEALNTLKKCTIELGEQWGFPAEHQARLAKPSRSVKKLREYFTSADYPVAALRQDASGRVRARIAVDESGRPTECVIMASSGNPALDAATCRILTARARFDPALDVAGKPMTSVAVATIYWILLG